MIAAILGMQAMGAAALVWGGLWCLTRANSDELLWRDGVAIAYAIVGHVAGVAGVLLAISAGPMGILIWEPLIAHHPSL